MNNQQFFIHDYAIYEDFKVVIVKVVSKDSKWFYEVRPVDCCNIISKLIPQEELHESKK